MSDKRKEKVCVGLTRTEYDRIAKGARALGITKSAYLRKRALDRGVPVCVDTEALYAVANAVGGLDRKTGELLRRARMSDDTVDLSQIMQGWHELLRVVHGLKTGKVPEWLT